MLGGTLLHYQLKSEHMTELFPHQKEGIEFLKRKKRAILADSMGMGKTRQAIVAAGEESDETTLIICPASLKINWEREIHMVYPEDYIVILDSKVKEIPCTPSWLIINYDILNKKLDGLLKMLKEGEIETIVFDEAHYVKDTKAIRTKTALLLAEEAKRVYCLTGTPVVNRPIELFSLLRAIKHPLAWSDDKAISTLRRDYGKRYCGAFFHKLGYTGRGFWDETGATRIPELKELIKDSFLRRTKEETLDLPEKIISTVSCEMTFEWAENYETAWDRYLAWVAEHPEGKDLGNILSAQALVELMKLKQVCSRAKIDRIVADVKNAVEQGEKVIIFSQFTGTIDALRHEIVFGLDIGAVTLTGRDDSETRQAAVDAFQNDPMTKVFIANIKAGGVGINLTAGSIVMFADMDWSPQIHNQAMDRAHRIGQKGTVNVYYYILEGTIEEDIMDVLSMKQETIGTLTGGETVIKPFLELVSKRATA